MLLYSICSHILYFTSYQWLVGIAIMATNILNTFYIIPNAETPSLGLPGLSPVGAQRATECIPEVFGPTSSYDIGYIITCAFNTNEPPNNCNAAYLTVEPLAKELKIDIDSSCGYTDEDWVVPQRPVNRRSNHECVQNTLLRVSQESTKAILIAWDIDHISDLGGSLNINNVPSFPETGNRNDLIWTIQQNAFVSERSMMCPGIDGEAPGTY